jgi:hypothetical protein
LLVGYAWTLLLSPGARIKARLKILLGLGISTAQSLRAALQPAARQALRVLTAGVVLSPSGTRLTRTGSSFPLFFFISWARC